MADKLYDNKDASNANRIINYKIVNKPSIFINQNEAIKINPGAKLLAAKAPLREHPNLFIRKPIVTNKNQTNKYSGYYCWSYNNAQNDDPSIDTIQSDEENTFKKKDASLSSKMGKISSPSFINVKYRNSD